MLIRCDDMLTCVPTLFAWRMLRLISEVPWALEMCGEFAGFGWLGLVRGVNCNFPDASPFCGLKGLNGC